MTTTWAGVIFVGTIVLALAVVYRPFGDYMARVLRGPGQDRIRVTRAAAWS